MYILKDYILSGNRVYLVPGHYCCSACKTGELVFFDYCRRIVRYEGNMKTEYRIPRCRCTNPDCGKVHRMLPDFMLPRLQYDAEVVKIMLHLKRKGEDPFFGEGPSIVMVGRWEKLSPTLFQGVAEVQNTMKNNTASESAAGVIKRKGRHERNTGTENTGMDAAGTNDAGTTSESGGIL